MQICRGGIQVHRSRSNYNNNGSHNSVSLPLPNDEQTTESSARGSLSFLDVSLCTHRETLEVNVSSLVQGAVYLAFIRNPWNTAEFALGATQRDATRRDAMRCDAGAPYEPEKPDPLTSPRGATPLSEESALGKHTDAPWESFFRTRVVQWKHSVHLRLRMQGSKEARLRLARSYIVNHIDLSRVAATVSDSENPTEGNYDVRFPRNIEVKVP